MRLLTRDLSRVRAHSIHGAGMAPQQRSYPVVFMRAGLAALTTDYAALAGRVIARAREFNVDLVGGAERERLANKLVRAWSADMAFALDQLEQLNASDPSGKFSGRLDLQRVGVFGHSLGGATALEFCHNDSRCKAGIDVDGAPLGSVIREGVSQPFLFLLSDHSGEPDAETGPIKANIRSIYNRLPGGDGLEIVIRGANHFFFSDGALLKSRIVLGTLRGLGILGMDGRRQIAVTAYCVHSFFDAYLKGARGSRLKTSAPLYPEIQVVE
jgi:hypothetical protein